MAQPIRPFRLTLKVVSKIEPQAQDWGVQDLGVKWKQDTNWERNGSCLARFSSLSDEAEDHGPPKRTTAGAPFYSPSKKFLLNSIFLPRKITR